MAQTNLFCDVPNCGEPAVAFGFIQTAKSRVCRDHILTLVDKRVMLFDIAAYNFLRTAQDGGLYEQRREWMQKGLGALTVLEAACERDLMEAHTQLLTTSAAMFQAALQAYQLQWTYVCQRYEEVRLRLQLQREHFELLLVERDRQLTAEEVALCEAVPSGPLFSLAVGDCVTAVKECIRSCVCLLPGTGKPDQARQPIPEDRDSKLSPSTETHIPAAQEHCKQGHFKRAVEELERGLSKLKQASPSEQSLQLNLALIEVHHQAAEWREAVLLCEHVLQVWSQSPHTIELLRTLYFLASSLHSLELTEKGLSLLDHWDKLQSSSSERQYLTGLKLLMRKDNAGAVKSFKQGLDLNEQPTSYLTASALGRMGRAYELLGQLEPAEDHFRGAEALFQKHFPCCVDFGACLIRLGTLSCAMGRLSQAETQLLAAQKLFATAFPQAVDFGVCVNTLGALYLKLGRDQEAEQQFEVAATAWAAVGGDNYANALLNLAKLYHRSGRLAQAETQYEQTFQVTCSFNPKSRKLPICQAGLGALYQQMKLTSKAEAHYLQACQLFAANHPAVEEYAECLMELAEFYKATRNKKKALAKAKAAEKIYTALGNDLKTYCCSTFIDEYS